MTARLDGVDISHYQGSTFPWQWIADQGCRFGACKMTEGTSGVDWTGPLNRAEIGRVGLRWRGMYHYCRAGDPKGNAGHFADKVGALGEHEFVFPDLESGMTDEVGAVVAMLEAFEAIYPGRVADYQGKYFAHGDSAAYDPWPWILPAYPWPNQIIPQTTRPVVMWQYAGGAHGVTVPGTRDFGAGPIPIGNVDSNMVIDVVSMDRICGLTATTPPTPPPIPPIPPATGDDDMGLYCKSAEDGTFWAIYFDAYGNRVACPVAEMPDPDWEEFAEVQDDLGPLKPVRHAALQRLYDKRGKPQLPPTVVPIAPGVPRHFHIPGDVAS